MAKVTFKTSGLVSLIDAFNKAPQSTLLGLEKGFERVKSWLIPELRANKNHPYWQHRTHNAEKDIGATNFKTYLDVGFGYNYSMTAINSGVFKTYTDLLHERDEWVEDFIKNNESRIGGILEKSLSAELTKAGL